jgi:hypothetical protein
LGSIVSCAQFYVALDKGSADGSPFTDDTVYRKLAFVNWRKTYYQVTRPQVITKPTITKFIEGLKDSFILPEEITADEVVLNNETGALAGSWLDKADMVSGGIGRVLVVGAQNKAHFHGLFKDNKKPLEMHLFFCHLFPVDAVAVVNANVDIAVTIKLKTALTFYNGESGGKNKHHMLIATCNPGARTDDDVNGTVTHETGHGLHMAADSTMSVPGIADPAAEHTRHYERNGDHCATDIDATEFATKAPDQWTGSGSCVMYGWGHPARKHKFCVH